MRIFKDKFIDVPEEVWKPLWNETLRVSHPCPLTSSMVVRSKGMVTVPVTYSLDGEIITKEKEVLFDENSPSLSSENSMCFGACVHIISPEFKWIELEILSWG